jgi:hypothetical protein
VRPERVLCKDLQTWAVPPAGRVAIDVRRGRMTFPPGEEPAEVRRALRVGLQRRHRRRPVRPRATFAEPAPTDWVQHVAKGSPVETLQQALDLWVGLTAGRMASSRSPTATSMAARSDHRPARRWQPHHPRGRRAASPADRLVTPRHRCDAQGARLALNGLLIEGAIELDGVVTLDTRALHARARPHADDEGEPWFTDRDSHRHGGGR